MCRSVPILAALSSTNQPTNPIQPESIDQMHKQVLVDKIWGLLLKSKVVADPDAEDEGI